jgi:hypothetical protein
MNIRNKTLLLLATLAISLLSSCGSSASSSQAPNQAPSITGVPDEATVTLGETYNALSGVIASDPEDGILTSSIVITSTPTLVNNEGLLYPEMQGEYYLTYAVTDSGSLTTEVYSTLIDSAPNPTETIYQQFDFSSDAVLDMHGWELVTQDTAIATSALSHGRLAIQIDNPGLFDNSVILQKDNIALVEATDYEMVLTIKASYASSLVIQIVDPLDSSLLTASDVLSIDLSTTDLLFTFTAPSTLIDGEVSILLGDELGVADSILYFDEITINQRREVEVDTELIVDDFSLSTDPWNYNVGAGATALLDNADGKLSFTISNYALENNPWNINLFRPSPINLVSGNDYELRFLVTTLQSQFFEVCFENSAMDWQIRAGFNDGTWIGSEEYSYRFTASMNITGLYLKIALGRGSASSNTITIDDFSFVSIGGNTEITGSSDSFIIDYDNSVWQTFSESDGRGYGYLENDMLHYHIEAFGTTDWHNKVVIRPNTLEAMARYRVEFDIVASMQTEGLFIVNEIGQWNPFVNQGITVTTTAATLSFEIDEMLYSDYEIELLWQFGGYPNNTAPTTIMLFNLTIYRIA